MNLSQLQNFLLDCDKDLNPTQSIYQLYYGKPPTIIQYEGLNPKIEPVRAKEKTELEITESISAGSSLWVAYLRDNSSFVTQNERWWLSFDGGLNLKPAKLVSWEPTRVGVGYRLVLEVFG